MKLSSGIKTSIGNSLLSICESWPSSKRFLRKLGMRTSKEWFRGKTVTVQMREGRQFRLSSMGDNYLSFELFWRGADYYEPITNRLAQELVGAGDTFIDIGANVGFYTLTMATIHPGLQIVAFEPNPKNYSLLQGNVAANKFKNISCEPMAMSDTEGVATLFLSESDMSASLQPGFETQAAPPISVPTTTVDHYLAWHPAQGRIVIKVDVEGHEEQFLAGAHRTIASCRPDIIAEVTAPYEKHVEQYLTGAGYRFYSITNRGLLPRVSMVPAIYGRFVFLNYLLSARPPEEIAAIFERIRPGVEQLDLRETSKFVSPAMIEKLHAPETRVPATSNADLPPKTFTAVPPTLAGPARTLLSDPVLPSGS